MSGAVSSMAAIVMVATLVGCRSSNEPPKGAAGETGEAAPPDAEPPMPAPAPPPASSPGSSSASEPSCEATLIRREGLDTNDQACTDRIAAIEALPPTTFACNGDADCRILSVAGGCLGINAGAGAEVEALPATCARGSCRAATFDDHRIRCEEGCCLIYEE